MRPQMYANALVPFLIPTSDERTIISHAIKVTKEMFKDGYGYKKAGVIANRIVSEDNVMYGLFEDTENIAREHRITSVLDSINKTFGKDTIRLAAQGNGIIKSSSENQSPHYTTLWSDIPTVSVK